MVWRVTPGEPKRVFATGIGDPNFILVRSDGSMWVSDDGTNEIFLVDADGNTELWSHAVDYPMRGGRIWKIEVGSRGLALER